MDGGLENDPIHTRRYNEISILTSNKKAHLKSSIIKKYSAHVLSHSFEISLEYFLKRDVALKKKFSPHSSG